MNSALTAPIIDSLQWMIEMGVSQGDVLWLELLSGSVELHMPGNRDRVERIWKTAISAMLKSESPISHLAQALK